MVLTFTFDGVCAGGGHATVNVDVDGVPVVLTVGVDDLRAAATAEERRAALLAILAERLRGKTRAQAAASFPFTVTI